MQASSASRAMFSGAVEVALRTMPTRRDGPMVGGGGGDDDDDFAPRPPRRPSLIVLLPVVSSPARAGEVDPRNDRAAFPYGLMNTSIWVAILVSIGCCCCCSSAVASRRAGLIPSKIPLSPWLLLLLLLLLTEKLIMPLTKSWAATTRKKDVAVHRRVGPPAAPLPSLPTLPVSCSAAGGGALL